MTMRNVLCTRVRPGKMQGGGSLGCLWLMAGVLLVAPMTAEASATLDLRFASKDWGGNTLTLVGEFNVNGGNGDVALRVQDSATIDVGGSQVVLTGGTHAVSVIVTDSGSIKAHD